MEFLGHRRVVILAALIQKYNSAWMESVTLGYSTTKRLVKWVFGRAELRVESEPVDRYKDNVFNENLKEFFRQCERPVMHTGRSIERSRKRVQEEWHDFRNWWENTISVSYRSTLTNSMRGTGIEKTDDVQLGASNNMPSFPHPQH